MIDEYVGGECVVGRVDTAATVAVAFVVLLNDVEKDSDCANVCDACGAWVVAGSETERKAADSDAFEWSTRAEEEIDIDRVASAVWTPTPAEVIETRDDGTD